MRAKLLLLALLAVLAWEVAATLVHSSAAPTDGDWRTAAAGLRMLHKAGEPILVAPQWAERVARQHLGDMLDIEMASLADVDRFARVWELSSRGSRHRWLDGASPKRTWRFGRIRLALFIRQAEHVLFDFRARIDAAEVDLVGDSKQSCSRRGKRFLCDRRHSWSWVGQRLMEIGYRPYTCIYAHPSPAKRLRIKFDNVPLGGRIVGYTGIGDFISRRDISRQHIEAPVLFQLFVGDTLVHSVRHQNEWPFTRFEASTDKYASAKHHVRFEISAPNTQARTFCFHAEARQ